MIRALFSILFFSTCVVVTAEEYQAVMDGPVHEAYLVRESGCVLLRAVPHAPPPKITELPTRQKDSQAIWIPGYWFWSSQHSVFLWVSGVWRRPPPGMHWVNGHWKNYPEGWVRVSGFWTTENPDRLNYLKMPPPSKIDERVSSPPPMTSATYFWVPGFWKFDSEKRHYIWYSGRWDLMDSNWVYCPAHYVWRELGYVFIPGFWDWPVNLRGEVFSAIYVNGEALETLVYEPSEKLDPLFVMEIMFPYWPDYQLLYLHHYNHYYNEWSAWGAAPPWWNWPAWAGFPHSEQWGLWWWWTHPGYVNPQWITPSLAQSIPPAPQFVKNLMKRTRPPAIVTPDGVVTETAVLQALTQVSGFNLPVLPSDPKQLRQIREVASPVSHALSETLTAKGKEARGAQPPDKPFAGPSVDTLRSAPRRVILPKRPFIQEEQAKPKPAAPRQRTSVNQISQPTPPAYQPYQPRPYAPPIQYPRQEYQIEYQYPQPPLQTQHLNDIMGSPQFQENPAGPKAHMTPGDYSTLPGQ